MKLWRRESNQKCEGKKRVYMYVYFDDQEYFCCRQWLKVC